MDWQTTSMIIKLILFLPLIYILIVLSLKFSGNKLQSIQNGKYIKIIERISLSKENSLIVAKIGEKGYVISNANNKVEILLNIEDEEIKKIEAAKVNIQYDHLNLIYKDVLRKLKIKKGDKDE